METSWQNFINSMNSFNGSDYGDFKRQMDSDLRRLVETSPPLKEAQAKEIVKIREEYLWKDHEDHEIDIIKRRLCDKILEISTMH